MHHQAGGFAIVLQGQQHVATENATAGIAVGLDHQHVALLGDIDRDAVILILDLGVLAGGHQVGALRGVLQGDGRTENIVALAAEQRAYSVEKGARRADDIPGHHRDRRGRIFYQLRDQAHIRPWKLPHILLGHAENGGTRLIAHMCQLSIWKGRNAMDY